jgi:hypothetical protein
MRDDRVAPCDATALEEATLSDFLLVLLKDLALPCGFVGRELR